MENLPGKGENPSSLRSKTALMIALTDLLTEKELSEISILEITERAGLSRQTFYTNFSKKEDILDDTVRRLFQMYAEHIREITLATDSVIVDYFSFWSEHRIFLSVLFKNNLGYLFFARNTSFFENELGTFTSSFADSQEEIPYIQSFLSSTFFSMLRTWIVHERSLNIRELAVLIEGLLEGRLLI